jgi:hypothetical protein
MEKPEIKVDGDKLHIKQEIAKVDMDGDGVKSVVLGVYAEADKAELVQEVMMKIMSQGGLPDWFKNALGK